MAQKCAVLGMLIVVHSLGLIFASLFTHKWLVSDTEDIGIFAICKYKLLNDSLTVTRYGIPMKYSTCNQIMWPDSIQANSYIARKPAYLKALMAVAIASCALGFLAFVCSFLTVTFHALGKNPHSSELMLLLSTLTAFAIVATVGLFLGKDDQLYSFNNYGVSFWCSVGAACGFFLSMVIFSINRINTGFKYKLEYFYETKFDS